MASNRGRRQIRPVGRIIVCRAAARWLVEQVISQGQTRWGTPLQDRPYLGFPVACPDGCTTTIRATTYAAIFRQIAFSRATCAHQRSASSR